MPDPSPVDDTAPAPVAETHAQWRERHGLATRGRARGMMHPGLGWLGILGGLVAWWWFVASPDNHSVASFVTWVVDLGLWLMGLFFSLLGMLGVH